MNRVKLGSCVTKPLRILRFLRSRQFRRLCLKFHPDKYSSNLGISPEQGMAMFQIFNNACEFLKDRQAASTLTIKVILGSLTNQPTNTTQHSTTTVRGQRRLQTNPELDDLPVSILSACNGRRVGMRLARRTSVLLASLLTEDPAGVNKIFLGRP